MPSTGPATPERVLRRLEWRVIRRLDGQLQGDYRTLLRGSGIDLADLREYEPGDDVRAIDWNVTARTDEVHVRTYHEDRDLTAWLLLDRSPSMGFGTAERPKELVLAELAVTFARLVGRGGNRVGALLYDNGVTRTVPPGSGRNQVLRIAHELLQPVAPRPDADRLQGRRRRRRDRAAEPAVSRATDLGQLFAVAAGVMRRRSLAVVVSDFISEPRWERGLALLGERHEVVAMQLYDRRELELPDAGWLVVEDIETGELLSVDTSDPEFRRRFTAMAHERQAEVEAAARRAGIELYRISTDDDLARTLVRIVQVRRHRGRRH